MRKWNQLKLRIAHETHSEWKSMCVYTFCLRALHGLMKARPHAIPSYTTPSIQSHPIRSPGNWVWGMVEGKGWTRVQLVMANTRRRAAEQGITECHFNLFTTSWPADCSWASFHTHFKKSIFDLHLTCHMHLFYMMELPYHLYNSIIISRSASFSA